MHKLETRTPHTACLPEMFHGPCQSLTLVMTHFDQDNNMFVSARLRTFHSKLRGGTPQLDADSFMICRPLLSVLRTCPDHRSTLLSRSLLTPAPPTSQPSSSPPLHVTPRRPRAPLLLHRQVLRRQGRLLHQADFRGRGRPQQLP